MADEIKASPVKREWALKLADYLRSGRDIGNKVNLPVVGGLGDMFIGQSPEGFERVAYDEPLTSGKGWTTRLRPETVDMGFLLADVAPTAKALVKGLRKGTEAASTAAVRGITGNPNATPIGVIDEIQRMNLLPSITKNIKPETLEQLGKYFDESAIEAIKAPLDYKGRQTTVLMNPSEFLAYAAKDAPDKLKAAGIEQKFAEGSKLAEGNIPQLWFDQEGNVASITGHEGRHRARYLQEQGVELMPVNIQSSGIRWSEQANPNRFDYVQEWPQTLQNQDLTMNTPFPLTREGEYISAMNEQKAMQDPFWRQETTAPKANKAEIDALAAEFEDFYKNNNGTPLGNAVRNYGLEHRPMTIEGGAAPLHELTSSFGEDVYGKQALQFYGSGDPREKQALEIMKSVRGNPDAPVTIYRGVPEGVNQINRGDWVTVSPEVAADYGNVISQQVPASHITSWPDSLLEFGYYPPKAE